MKNIIHFSTEDFGGAGSAALRVHEVYKQYGFNSILFCKNKRTDREDIVVIKPLAKNFYFRVLNKIEAKLNLFNNKYYFFEKNRNTLRDIKPM